MGGFNIRNCSCKAIAVAICYGFMLLVEWINMFLLMLFCRAPPTQRELGMDILFAAEQALFEAARNGIQNPGIAENDTAVPVEIEDVHLGRQLKKFKLETSIQKKRELLEERRQQMEEIFKEWKSFSASQKELKKEIKDLENEDEKLSEELFMQLSTFKK